MRIRWTRLAFADLAAARDQVSEDDPRAARQLLAKVAKAVAQLRRHPRSGRVVPERRALGYRELVLPPYRLVYALAGDELHVLRFWHSRRDPAGI